MRTIDPALAAALSGASFNPIVLVYLDWPGGAVRAHSGAGSITWGGQSWSGVGKFGDISVPEESASGVPVDFALSVVCDLAELADYADAVIRQRAGVIYLGATTTPGGNVLIGDPVAIASGTMDTSVLSLSVDRGGAAPVTLYRLTVGMTTGPGYRSSAGIAHSHEDQSRAYPGDTAGKMLVLATARAATALWPAP